MSLLRSLLFLLWFAAITIAVGMIGLPLLLGPRKPALWLSRNWARAVLWGLKVFAGVRMRITGTVPKAPVATEPLPYPIRTPAGSRPSWARAAGVVAVMAAI